MCHLKEGGGGSQRRSPLFLDITKKKQRVSFPNHLTESAFVLQGFCPLTCFGFTLERHNRQTLSCIFQSKITICLNSLEEDQMFLDKCNI